MAYKVIVPQKKNYVPQFLKQQYINSYYVLLPYIIYVMESGRFSQCPAFLLTIFFADFKTAGHKVEGFYFMYRYCYFMSRCFEIREKMRDIVKSGLTL